jgi:hypothetical protein
MACNKEPDPSESLERCALYAVFETGKTPQADVVCADGDANSNGLRWLWSDGSMDAFVEANNHWTLDSERLPQPGEAVLLQWDGTHGTTDVLLEFPPAIVLESLSADTLFLEQNQPIDVQWTDLGDDYEYVLSLQCLEEDAAPIDMIPGNFDALHNGPQVGNTLSLEAQNFTFLGTHRLVIYALNRAFTDVYFFDPSDIRGLLKMPISNLPGSNGYVMSVTAREVTIEVE